MQGIAVVLGDAGADGFVVENLVVVDYIGTPVSDVALRHRTVARFEGIGHAEIGENLVVPVQRPVPEMFPCEKTWPISWMMPKPQSPNSTVRSSSFDTATWLFHRIGLPASAQ